MNLYLRAARWLVLPAVIALALVIALTGGAGRGRMVSALAITRAADVTGRVVGAELSGSVIVNAAGRTVAMRLNGFESFVKRAGVLNFHIGGTPGAGGSALTMKLRFLYPMFYMSSSLLASALPHGVSWVSFNVAQTLRQAGINPSLMSTTNSDPAQDLDYLKAVSGGVRELGTQRIRGVLTRHYHALADLSRYAALAPSGKRAAVAQGLAKLEQLTGERKVPIDVWVDSRHLVRQLRIDISENPRTGVLSGRHLSEAVTLDLFNFGPQPSISAPPAGQTEPVSSLSAGGL